MSEKLDSLLQRYKRKKEWEAIPDLVSRNLEPSQSGDEVLGYIRPVRSEEEAATFHLEVDHKMQ